MSSSSVGICLLGCGVVGSGVLKILQSQAELLQRRAGVRFQVNHVVVRDRERYASTYPGVNITTDANAAIDDPRTQIVIELMGGTTTAAECIERALQRGKHVVTANKSLLAQRGAELFSLARKKHACIAFEASCGGGIPIIEALTRGLIANRIDALVGIVNGTCNVILTRMTRNGWSYQQALEEAQKLGFAEADPTLDVSGRDAAQKMALLAGLAFNVKIEEGDISIDGIQQVHPVDIQFAADLGYVIKLLAIAERADGKLALRVHPTLVHEDDLLADVSGSFNAISVWGNNLGHAIFYGRGAGQMPTASSVVADLVGVAVGTTPLAFERLRIFPDSGARADVLPIEQLESRYYLRLTARDVPGVMARVTDALGQQGIGLSAVLQRETTDEDRFVPIVITTHRANEGSVRKALQAIDALPVIQAPTVCLRVIDQPKEFAEH